MPDQGLLALFPLFVVGLLGGTHCVGMCGGIVGALSMQAPGGRPAISVHLAYNLGRIASYVLAGALAGTAGHAFGSLLPVQRGLYLFASLMLVAMGLYLLGVSQALTIVERGGQWLWARIQPATRRFLPVRGPAQALPLGALWGWLPCGLVYSALTLALASGSAARGALSMLAFGLGTLPNLLLAGLLLTRFRRFAQAPAMRIASGLLVLGFGLVGLANAARMFRG
ncbi:MAG: sulfite exporter TauE/SafE family protein [Candidatus Nitricoxidivorans perseverans]|uniref:Sulfite exporter TauE/SafE family protein n=1 Tax=Candidatus Nitricoxidivorans perseverans TaxID=2975601 RepID=A0AA49IYG4_9PROT|nr:MAG: sulfite exporter TauE/SafE family protein [Candidatus Nitricoxidivorans perseverans]